MDNRDIAEKKQFPKIYEYEESMEILIVNSKFESMDRQEIIPIVVQK